MFLLPKKELLLGESSRAVVVRIQSGVSEELCCRRMLTPESFITALINRAIVSYCKLNLCYPEILKLGRFKYSANTCPVMGKNEKCQSLINDIEGLWTVQS